MRRWHHLAFVMIKTLVCMLITFLSGAAVGISIRVIQEAC